jgi:alpha-methylacyl-CoA racemase
MVDGAAVLTTMIHGFRATGMWTDERGANLLDGGAPFYRAYETADGHYVAVGAIEPQFYAALLRVAGLEDRPLPDQNDRSRWPELQETLRRVFLTRTRDEWCRQMEGADACFAPVLTPGEAPDHPHNVARKTFVDVGGVIQPAPAPRFSRTPGAVQSPPAAAGDHTEQILRELGYDDERIARLRDEGSVSGGRRPSAA